ncbi:hypothetical protein [Halosimplex sp. TS25]|uniref:hypothetical protein n=1 Tax=Halosimplex rarum TaxID=3396619 RepID=UPI0039EBB36C
MDSIRSIATRAGGDGAGRDASAVSIESVTVDGGRIESTIEYSDDLRPFFDESPFYVEYDVDVSDLPPSILSIPVLAQVCPVAWTVGADVRVPVVDRRFLDSLEAVGRALYEMYPFIEGGRVIAERAPEYEEREGAPTGAEDHPAARDVSDATDGAGMLFTGGVDSLTTYVRHREEEPTLITVQGWVVGVDDTDRWQRMRDRTEGFAERFGVDAQFVRSNMLEFLDTTMLSAHFHDRHDGGWYSAVGSGLGLLGLCAPLAVATGMGRIYVAASVWQGIEVPPVLDHWDGVAMPWGSHPNIDDEIAWADVEGAHDAFELDRQGRIGVVADYVREHDSTLPVYSCSASEAAENCDRCEKCLRTAIGLALEGLDPADHGFDIGRDTFHRAVRKFEAGEWLNDEHAPYHWQDFQTRLSPGDDLPMDGSEEFLRWLQDADFEAIAGSPTRERLVRTAARHTPYPVYAAAYPLYGAVQNHLPGN